MKRHYDLFRILTEKIDGASIGSLLDPQTLTAYYQLVDQGGCQYVIEKVFEYYIWTNNEDKGKLGYVESFSVPLLDYEKEKESHEV